MPAKMILTGDVNLMNVTDPSVPFAQVADEFRSADVVFSNLECCLVIPSGHSASNEGFFADPRAGEALRSAGIHAVGIANNVHYGETNILSSIARLDEYGVLHAGAGKDLAAARAPAIVERDGMRFGFLQRSSVYWPTDHEARKDAAGIAVIRGHTAYHVPVFKTRVGVPPPNRPGVAPEIITWADADYLGWFRDDIAALRPARRRSRRLLPLGARQGGPQIHDGHRPCGHRCRRRPRHRPWPALLPADRSLQRPADLLRARQLFLPHRPWRTAACRLGGHDGAGGGRSQRRSGRALSIRPAQ